MAELFAGRWAASTAGDRWDTVPSARMPGCLFSWLLLFGQASTVRLIPEQNQLVAGLVRRDLRLRRTKQRVYGGFLEQGHAEAL